MSNKKNFFGNITALIVNMVQKFIADFSERGNLKLRKIISKRLSIISIFKWCKGREKKSSERGLRRLLGI